MLHLSGHSPRLYQRSTLHALLLRWVLLRVDEAEQALSAMQEISTARRQEPHRQQPRQRLSQDAPR